MRGRAGAFRQYFKLEIQLRDLSTSELRRVSGGLVGTDGWDGYSNVVWEVGQTGMGDNISYGGSNERDALTNVATGLATATLVLGVAAQVTRFIPGAQVLSAGLTVLGLGTAALAGAATRLN